MGQVDVVPDDGGVIDDDRAAVLNNQTVANFRVGTNLKMAFLGVGEPQDMPDYADDPIPLAKAERGLGSEIVPE